MASHRLKGAMIATVLIFFAEGAAGQGIPVIDQTAIAKQIESIAQLKSQLDALNQQIEQAQQLYGSLNKLTDMADVASVLNDPAIRKALPSDFAAIEGLLKGNGTGVFGDSASKFLDSNSTYRTSADDFYAKELSRIQSQNAGQMSLGQQIYDAATKRIDGIDQLREKISSASDPRTSRTCRRGSRPNRHSFRPTCCGWKGCGWCSKHRARSMNNGNQRIGANAWTP